MEKISLKEVIEATGGELLWGDENAAVEGITINSRECGENMLFIPIIGDKFDGHDFIRAAFDMGAVASLTCKETEAVCDHTIIKVEDTKKALADIAHFYIKKIRPHIVALTGSVGKTTTKDMIAAVLSKKFRTVKTPGNLNNDIGLPLTVFGFEKDTEMAVLEMGMNHFGEIEKLVSVAEPQRAVITNIGMSHIENLGSQEGILKAKMEITGKFGKESILFINSDDPFLKNAPFGDYKVITFAINDKDALYRAENIQKREQGIEFDVVYKKTSVRVRVNLPGEHNVYNALAAFAVAKSYSVPDDLIAEGLSDFVPSKMRMDIKKCGSVTLINDCYNSSPASARAALEVLCEIDGKRHIAILGDMLEMGQYAPEEHRKIGEKCAKLGVDLLLCTGEISKNTVMGANGERDEIATHFASNKALIAKIPEIICDGDVILIKASRGMKFEQITQAIESLADNHQE